jgi:hypothetical protein
MMGRDGKGLERMDRDTKKGWEMMVGLEKDRTGLERIGRDGKG